MPVDIFGTPVFHESITAPSNLDDTDGPSVADPCTQLQDNALWLRQQTKLRGGYGFVQVPTYAGASTEVELTLTPELDSPAFVLECVAGAVVQVALSVSPIDDFANYVARIVLHEPDEVVTLAGPPIAMAPDLPLSLLGHFEIVTAGDYVIKLRLTPLDLVTRAAKDYEFAVNATIQEGNQ